MTKRPFLSTQITVKGNLDDSWCDWFQDLKINQKPDGTTQLTGKVIDQSALMTILFKLHNMNFKLISVHCNESK